VDFLYGGNVGGDVVAKGNDILIGGLDEDELVGGVGSDIFDYNALSDRGTMGDAIFFFSKTDGDKLDLQELLDTFAGYNGFNAFTGGYLSVDFADLNGNTLVQVDSDGGANSFETLATLYGVPLNSIDATDFIL
jgi:hypothetical protein